MRGGTRKGAGRKPLDPTERRIKITMYLAPETVQELRKSSLSMGVQVDVAVSTYAGVYGGGG